MKIKILLNMILNMLMSKSKVRQQSCLKMLHFSHDVYTDTELSWEC